MNKDFQFVPSLENKNKIKRVFFYRICGTGMGSAAVLLKEKGLHVEGGDTDFKPPMSDYLKSTGINCHYLDKVTDEFLRTFDLIIVGNVVPKGKLDALRIEALGVPYTSFPAAIGEFILSDPNLEVVGICGTHGKTTTTYLITQIFENLGLNPGYFIGGVIDDRPSARLGDGKYFFIESDEYDSSYFHKRPKFHFYFIKHAIVTSLEFDHGDIYESLEQIEKEFEELTQNIKGHLIVSEDYPSSSRLTNPKGKKLIKFSMTPGNQWGPNHIQQNSHSMTFEIRIPPREFNKDENKFEKFETNIIGTQNALNLAAAINFTLTQGFPLEAVKKSIKNLKMVKRRQEIKGYYKQFLVIDDFAHHPRAVSITLESIKLKFPQKKIICFFEPASATARSDIFQQDFVNAFKECAALICLMPQKSTTVKNHGNLDCHLLMDQINQVTPLLYKALASSWEELKLIIDEISQKEIFKNDFMMVTLSNSTLMGLYEKEFCQESLKSV
jgi:UDP-N-acetylmuramate: L-alanyl-gamma-D-glutamyl-meso-diaminopimelate ligase